jgi:hypothetical membrane protein
MKVIMEGATTMAENINPTADVSQDASQRRAAGALLVTGPAIFLLAEFIAAAAWTDPPYSYTYDFISNLGVRGPSTLFGQYMYSPLAWLMNAAFIVFGLTILVGIVLLRGLWGWRRWATLTPAALLAAGGVLLGLFPGSGEAMEDGTGDLHALGAFAGFLGANVLAIMLGRMHRRVGFSRGTMRALISVGVIGLVSTTLYLLMIVRSTGGTTGGTTIGIIGLIERGATHPFLVGLLCAGASILHRPKRALLDAQPTIEARVGRRPWLQPVADRGDGSWKPARIVHTQGSPATAGTARRRGRTSSRSTDHPRERSNGPNGPSPVGWGSGLPRERRGGA